MKTSDNTLPTATLEKHDAVITGASTEEEKAAALAAVRKFQEDHHPKRVTIVVPRWNDKPVFHSGG